MFWSGVVTVKPGAKLLTAIPYGTPIQRLMKPGFLSRIFGNTWVINPADEPIGTPYKPNLITSKVQGIRLEAGSPVYTRINQVMQGLL